MPFSIYLTYERRNTLWEKEPRYKSQDTRTKIQEPRYKNQEPRCKTGIFDIRNDKHLAVAITNIL